MLQSVQMLIMGHFVHAGTFCQSSEQDVGHGVFDDEQNAGLFCLPWNILPVKYGQVSIYCKSLSILEHFTCQIWLVFIFYSKSSETKY